MSLDLSKIFSNETISRRDSLEAICNVGKITFLATTFPSFLRAQYYLDFKLTPFIYQNPWVKHEIINFLDQQEVRDALGFDPLNYKKPITLEITEHNKKVIKGEDKDRIIGAGKTYKYIWINAHLFSNQDPEPYLISQGFEKENYQEFLDMLTELRQDSEMLELYRGLTIVHEIAHRRLIDSYSEGKEIVLTDHGFTNRIEIKVLTNLYKSGKVDLEMSEKIIHFFEKYLNNEQQPQHEIDKYLKKHFGLR